MLMNFDSLLYWMTHLGEGSWGSFRKAVQGLTPEQTDLSDLCRNLRVHISELGYADFFIDKSQKWRVRSPILGGLVNQPEIAVLCGGRTPKLLAMIQKAAADNQCNFSMISGNDTPSRIQVEGSEKALRSIANSTGIQFVPSLAKELFGSLVSIEKQLDEAPEENPPQNWSVRSFDLQRQEWVENLLPDTAREYSTVYGQHRYFVANAADKLLALSKRESIYAAAMLKYIALARYNSDIQTLSVPGTAPLPDDFARVACISSGQPSRYEHGYRMYESLSPSIAALLLVGTGQPFPSMEWSK
jgi:hypothetical protein